MVAGVLVSVPPAHAGGSGAGAATPASGASPAAGSGLAVVAMPVTPGVLTKNSATPVPTDIGLPTLPPLPSWDGAPPNGQAAGPTVSHHSTPRWDDAKVSVAVHAAGANEYVSAKVLADFTAALRRGDLPGAKLMLDRLQRLDSEDNVEYLELAAMYQARAGDLEAALRLTQRALDVAPQDAVAQRNLRALQTHMVGASQAEALPAVQP